MLQYVKYTAVINKVKVIVHAEYSGTYGEVESVHTPHDSITNIKGLLSRSQAKAMHDKLQTRIHDLNASVDPMIAPLLVRYFTTEEDRKNEI